MIVALALVTAACGSVTRPIGIKEYPGDVVFGDQAKPPAPTIPPLAEPAPGFPAFIVPPAPRQLPTNAPAPPNATGATTTSTTLRKAAVVTCPEDDPLSVPRDESREYVPNPPTAETIPFRIAGSSSVDGKSQPLPTVAPHRISLATNVAPSAFRFDVGIAMGTAETVTTYQVDQRGAGNTADGVSIVQIRTTDQVATDAFTPSAPIRILPLPPVQGMRFSGVGSDPIHGTAIRIFGLVKGKTRVNACGAPLEGWIVEVGTDPQTGQTSAIQGPMKDLTMTGTFTVATQFGGLIIADDLTLDGTDNGQRVILKQASTANRAPKVSGS